MLRLRPSLHGLISRWAYRGRRKTCLVIITGRPIINSAQHCAIAAECQVAFLHH